jgi:endonuclease/exonuclease/phosphatase family metal-dependent hydrolase
MRWAAPLAVVVTALATIQTTADASPAITGLKVAKVTHTSFTVTLDSQGDGWRYRLYASTNKPDIFFDKLKSAPYQSSLASKPRITLSNLPYRAKAYWWRVQAVKNGSHRTGAIRSVGLKPEAPTGLRVSTAGGGVALVWGGAASNGFQVQRSADPSFSTGVKTYDGRGLGKVFTPSGLSVGTTYNFRVRNMNVGTPSAWSSTVQAPATSRMQPLRIGQFNVHKEGSSLNGVPPWKDRRQAVAQSVRDGGASVLGIQEAAGFVAGKCSDRQVDDLAKLLGNNWVVAHTDPIPCKEPNWGRTGVYIIYDSNEYRAVGAVGHWKLSENISKPWWAAYQELENKATGARFLMVSTHLVVGNDTKLDKEREAETKNMVQHVAALNLGLPVVYSGDFNSHDGRSYDGPGIAMRDANVADAWYVAQHRVRAKYNSANNYQRRPPHTGDSLDHIYGSPGVALLNWKLIMKLKDGAYVGVIPSDHNQLVSDINYPY